MSERITARAVRARVAGRGSCSKLYGPAVHSGDLQNVRWIVNMFGSLFGGLFKAKHAMA